MNQPKVTRKVFSFKEKGNKNELSAGDTHTQREREREQVASFLAISHPHVVQSSIGGGSHPDIKI